MFIFDNEMLKEENEALLKTSIFWEMQAIEKTLNKTKLTALIERIATLEYYQVVKNYHLYTYDYVTPCDTWEEYCA